MCCKYLIVLTYERRHERSIEIHSDFKTAVAQAVCDSCNRAAYDIRGKYGVITVTSKNAETSFHVLTRMFDIFMPEGE